MPEERCMAGMRKGCGRFWFFGFGFGMGVVPKEKLVNGIALLLGLAVPIVIWRQADTISVVNERGKMTDDDKQNPLNRVYAMYVCTVWCVPASSVCM
jgi:hypothetical protein